MKAAQLGALLVLCLLAPLLARAQALHRLDVDVFNSGTVWPIWVAQDKGFFATNGLDVHLIPTPGSLAQMEGLIDGKFDIAMTAIDNLIAYMEGEGEAKTEAAPNIVAVMGSDNGFLSLLTAPGIKSFAALRGATLSVDAFTTGYAFVLEEMLKVARPDEQRLHAGQGRWIPAALRGCDRRVAGRHPVRPALHLPGSGEGFQRSRHRHLRPGPLPRCGRCRAQGLGTEPPRRSGRLHSRLHRRGHLALRSRRTRRRR